MRKGVLFFLLFYTLLAPSIFSAEVFAPFVSSLAASVKDNTVTLTWKKAPASVYGYSIYRSEAPFNSNTFTDAVRIGAVDEDATTFTYTPPDTQNYYYAVLGRDEKGSLYTLFIPYRNVLMEPVSVSTTLSPEQVRTRITSLEASAAENSIELRFQSSRPNRSVIIYRSINPIFDSTDLVPATAVTSLEANKTSYIDYPLSGVPYYYAVFDADATKSGQYSFSPGENTLRAPVEIPLTDTNSLSIIREEPMRITPLPFLLLNSSILSGNQIERDFNYTRNTQELSDDTLQAWTSLENRINGFKNPEKTISPILLDIDMSKDLSGEDYQLSVIVTPSFSSSQIEGTDWSLTEKQLASFLSVRHSETVEDRGHFYLGQVYFFQEKYTQAFFEFLLAKDSYFNQCQPWIDRLFPLIAS